MAVTFTVTKTKVYVVGDRKEVIADVACTGVPTVGGDAITAITLGLDGELDCLQVPGSTTNTGGTAGLSVAAYHSSATPASATIVFYVQGTAAAGTAMVAYTGDTVNHVFRVRAIGKGPASV